MVNRTCRLCSRSVGKGLKLQCGRCSGYFHLDCGNISEVDARLMQAQKTSWTCSECLTNISRRSSVLYSPHRTSDVGVAELKIMIKDLQEEVKGFKRSMDFMNEKFEEERERNKIMAEMFSELAKDNHSLRSRVEALEKAIKIENVQKIKQNLCISGLPLNAEARTKVMPDDLPKICSALKVPATAADFTQIQCYITKNGTSLSVSVSSLELKNRILAARSQMGKITLKTCGLGASETPIYINEELTKDVYSLFKSAKRLRDKGFKYVWHKNGKILARKEDGDRAILINSEDFLNKLLE